MLLFLSSAMAMGTIPQATPSATPIEHKLIGTITYGPSVDKDSVDKAVSMINYVYNSGCIKDGVLKHQFKSLNTVTKPSPILNEQAYDSFTMGAPYNVELRWYWKEDSKTIGYTYNYFENTKKSEYRIWTNRTKFPGGMASDMFYASHLAHELSHQVRAGGFVHYTIHAGSFPYDIGNIVFRCITREYP